MDCGFRCRKVLEKDVEYSSCGKLTSYEVFFPDHIYTRNAINLGVYRFYPQSTAPTTTTNINI